jgi:DNA-binding CsgD family transcriptional regulator
VGNFVGPTAIEAGHSEPADPNEGKSVARLQQTIRTLSACVDESNRLVGADDCKDDVDLTPDDARSMAEVLARVRNACEAFETRLHGCLKPASRDCAPWRAKIPTLHDGTHGQAGELLHETALRAVGNIQGMVLLVDLEEQRIVWSSPSDADARHWSNGRRGKAIVAATARLLERPASDCGLRRPMRLGGGDILRIAPIADAAGGSARFAAVHLARTTMNGGARVRLSPREQQVAWLLADGCGELNAAERLGVKRNTIRTLTRRIYKKLGVFNRADLVRNVLRLARPAGAP